MTTLIAVTFSTLALPILVIGCTATYKVPIDTPTHATLDVSAFQRILVAGFIGAGTTEVDTNGETVRLLRSQLRSKTSLKVIEAEILPLVEIAARDEPRIGAHDVASKSSQNAECGNSPKSEKDLAACQHVFANAVLWTRLGEEYQNSLIVTGTLLFTPVRRGGSLQATFIFIDGRTGAVMHVAGFREKVFDGSRRYVPALSSYFLVMDRVLPGFLRVLTDAQVRGTRTLFR